MAKKALKKMYKGVDKAMGKMADCLKYIVEHMNTSRSKITTGFLMLGIGVGIGGALIISGVLQQKGVI